MNSPLGKYGQVVAAVLAVLIVAAWIGAEYLHALGLMPGQPAGLKEVALISVGAVFGSTATINGVKPAIEAGDRKAEQAHTRLDVIGAPHVASPPIAHDG